MAGSAFFLGACIQDDGPTCDNLTAAPCSDCDPTNPAHLACYDAFTFEVLPVLRRYCLGCHSSGGIGEFFTGDIDSGLNFEPGLAYPRMLMPSFGDSGATRRVVPGNPGSSALYNKIVADLNTVWFGAPMPQGNALINTDSAGVEAIRKWIARGAKPPAGSSSATRISTQPPP